MQGSLVKTRKKKSQSYIPAPIGARIAAGAIDAALVAAIVGGLLQLLDGTEPRWYLIVGAILIFVLYHTIFVWVTQQTPGKALMGLRVTRVAKEPGFLWALGRSGIGYPIIDFFGLGFFAAFFNPSRQSLHDLAFGSAVTMEDPERPTAINIYARFERFAEEFLDGVEDKTKSKSYYLIKDMHEYLFAKPVAVAQYLTGLGSGAAQAKAIVAVTTIGSGVVAGTAVTNGKDWLAAQRCEPDCSVSSHFSGDSDGWRLRNGGTNLSYDSSQAAISAEDARLADNSNEWGAWYWEAPKKFLGDKKSYYGRDLCFKLKSQDHKFPRVSERDIVLKSIDFELTYDISKDLEPRGSWKCYCVPLSPGASPSWLNANNNTEASEIELRGVLGDLNMLLIRGEYGHNPVGRETSWMRDVTFGAASESISCEDASSDDSA